MIHLPKTSKKRVVIVGGGFAGLKLIDNLDSKLFQVVLIDQNNYHQFPPLLYQVASSGLEPSSICFPYRKLLRNKKDVYFRLATFESVDAEKNVIYTSIGELAYDYLVMATGTTTNFYGMQAIEKVVIPMKSVEEAMQLRNTLLLGMEEALNASSIEQEISRLNVVIVGGGATGVEIAGAISEMKRYVVPKDYPDLKSSRMKVYLIEGTDKLLGAMSESSSNHSLESLQQMGVQVLLNKKVIDYKDGYVLFDDGDTILTQTLIWVSGVVGNEVSGFQKEQFGRGRRVLVDEYNRVNGFNNIYALGDICLQTEANYSNGHPQVAPVAIQQGKLLGQNLKAMQLNKSRKPFRYKNQGSLATIGRNKAVADLKSINLHGFPAWAVWMLVHLRSILGIKNKVMVLIDWMWNYITYDQSSRFIFFIPKKEPKAQ